MANYSNMKYNDENDHSGRLQYDKKAMKFNMLDVLSLQESYSLSVLIYSCYVETDQWIGHLLMFCMDWVGRLYVTHLITVRKVNFYNHWFVPADSVLNNVFNFVMVHNYSGDDM